MFHEAIEKNKNGTFLWTLVSRVIPFLRSSIASGNNKEYLTAAFKNFVPFFWTTLYMYTLAIA